MKNMKIKKSIVILVVLIFLSLLNINTTNISAAEVSGLQNNKVYRLRNVATGKYLHVSGNDNWANIYMYNDQSGNTLYQNFKLKYNVSSDTYSR